MKILAEWVVRAFILLVTAYIVPGFHIDSYTTALVVALVLGLLNLVVKPLLLFFTLPATVLTLGLFIFVVNALLLILASAFVKGFKIDSFGTAILAAVAISILSALVNLIFR